MAELTLAYISSKECVVHFNTKSNTTRSYEILIILWSCHDGIPNIAAWTTKQQIQKRKLLNPTNAVN